MHPYSRASIASALNSRTLSLHGALGRSKSSRENLLMHAHAALFRWLISCVSSPSSLTRPPKYRNWVVWAYFCPAASMTSGGGGDPPFFGCFSVLCFLPIYSGHQVRWTYTSRGHTGLLIHLLSAVRALVFLARRIQSFLFLVDREVEFCVLTV